MRGYHPQHLNKIIDRINKILLVTISSGFLLKFILIFKYQINWDEFYFLAKAHSFQRGELLQPFQNFHVHFLGWLPWVSENEVAQIIAARCSLFFLFIASGVLIYRISRAFISKTGALFAVFCWLSLSNVIQHGSSLRYDSFCSFLFLLACFALLQKNRHRISAIIAGVAMGIALLISVKAAIHVVSLLALIVSLGAIHPKKRTIFRIASLFVISLALTFGVGFGLHQEALASAAEISKNSLPLHVYSNDVSFNRIPSAENFLHRVASKTIVFNQLFPRLVYFAKTLQDNLIIWILMGVGVSYSLFEFSNNQKQGKFLPLTFLIPLITLPFYRNAYPYYYFFIIAPAIIYCGILPQKIIRDFQKTGSRALLLVFAFIYLSITSIAGFHFFKAFNQTNSSQMEILTVIHQTFPDPVAYIDGCSAVASYSKVGFFMSTWGFENYLAIGQPIFRQILQKEQPQFLLANMPQLYLDLSRENRFFRYNYDLLAEDRKILEENFIWHWSILWVAGKTLQTEKQGVQLDFEILIPGPYIVESKNQVILDNVKRSPGEKIILTAGKHKVEPFENQQKIVLRWNIRNSIKKNSPAKKLFFYDF